METEATGRTAGPVAPPAGAHGGDGARLARTLGIAPDDVLDLSASLNPAAPDVAALVARHLSEVRRYPDATAATAAMAAALDVEPDRVLLTNGGAEAIALLSAAVGGRVVEPEFSLHPRSERGPLWRSNPHNPTGELAPTDERADVWDEAFYALATGTWSRRDEGAAVVGSLTKVFACPGLRLGYVVASDRLVGELRRSQPGWSVNGLATAVLPELLEQADLGAWAARIAVLRSQLVALLSAHDLTPRAADAPWVLCDGGAALRERLAPHAVLVRDCASFGLRGIARVAVADEAGLERLATALDGSAP